jgi:hypothetical protein
MERVFSLREGMMTKAHDRAGRTVMANEPVPSGPGDRRAVANYVATLSADLATMAHRTGMETLGYLLEMVRLEAENASRHETNGIG